MRIRGDRTCQDCGAQWSYYETGSVTCPACGSIRSTGDGERTRHTDRSAALDLRGPRSTAAEGDLETALDEAADACLEYVRKRGFVDGGSLRDLDEAYVHAQELRHAATLSVSRLELSDTERAYLLDLLGGEAGDRPSADSVPETFRTARGLGVATAVRDYRDDLRQFLDAAEDRPAARSLLESVAEHEKRIRALDGQVDPVQTAQLLAATRAVGTYCRTGAESDLEAARETLAGIS
ncbi:MAG: DUF7117 family protein [Halobacteriota archaeon]